MTGQPGPRLPGDWAELSPLVDQLLNTPQAERAALLNQLGGGDPGRRAALEQLVRECELELPLLNRPAVERFDQLSGDEPGQPLPEVLGGRYRIEREVGAGGMATVYLARDEQHDRRVAIKVLRPEIAAALGAERFLREIKLTAALQHPHILPLFDSGQVPETGLVFYVMPFIEGESLRERLLREQQLSLPDALQIVREVADALAYAHDLGLVHRDIKPENIMLSRGHALVADFGIARAITAAKEGDKLTGTGMAIGTVDYMSPEQAVGGDDVDARSDQYSLGCVLYEMLAGGPPFSAPTAQGVLARHLVDPVPSLRTLRSTVPVPVEAAIVSALAKAKADRFPSVLAFVEALDGRRPSPVQPYPAAVLRRSAWTTLVAAVVALGVVGFLAWRFLRPPPINDHRVLVGLFEDRTGDAALAGMAAQVATEVTGGLARTGLVEVVDARSATADQASATDLAILKKTARKRGAGSIVWGSYTKAGDSVVFQIQIADAATGAVLRPLRSVSGPAAAPAELAALLAERVMAGYAAHFDRRLHNYSAMSQPGTYQAWKEFDAGWKALSGYWSDSVLRASKIHMDRATQLDPQFVLPQAINVASIGWSQRDCPGADSLANALRQSSQRLTEGDEALVKLGSVECHPDPQAEYEATTVLLRAAPGVPEWMDVQVGALMTLYRPREALAVLESSDELKREDPFAWNNRRMLLLHMLGRYQDALKAVGELRRANPDDRFVDRYEMRQLAALGQADSVDKLLEVRLGKTNRFADAGADLYYVGMELKSHGFRDAGLRACHRAVEWYAARPGGEGDQAPDVVNQALLCAERWIEARQALQAKLAIDSLNHNTRSVLGVSAFHSGDRAAADSADQVLARFGRDPDAVFGRAMLATLRGDREGAIRYLQWAVDHGISWGRLHTFITDFAPLTDDSRVRAMLHPDR